MKEHQIEKGKGLQEDPRVDEKIMKMLKRMHCSMDGDRCKCKSPMGTDGKLSAASGGQNEKCNPPK